MNNVMVELLETARIPTSAGIFRLQIYANNQDKKEHLAFIMGDITNHAEVLVRIHSECFTGDVLGSQRCDCGEQLARAMQQIAQAGSGMIIYLRQEGRGIGLLDKLRAYNLQDEGYDTVEANLMLGHQADARDYTIAAAILKQLGINSIQLLTNNPQKIKDLTGLGITVSQRVPLYGTIQTENRQYWQTKLERMHHFPPTTAPSAPSTLLPHIDHRLADAPQIYHHHHRPFVTLSYAQTLDGSITLKAGQHVNISNKASYTVTHYLRANHQALVVGIGTLLADDPELTVRHVNGVHPQPIVLDSTLQTPLTCKLLQHPDKSLWIMTAHSADLMRQTQLEAAGARVFRLPLEANSRLSLTALLDLLAEQQIERLMVEGGSHVITEFIKQKLVDQVVLTIGPLIAGGLRGVHPLDVEHFNHLPHLEAIHYDWLAENLMVRGDMRWPS